MKYNTPEYCTKISVTMSCNRKGKFTITGEDAEKILARMTEETVFSTNDDNVSVTFTPVPEEKTVRGSVNVVNGKCHELVKEYLKGAPLCVSFWDMIIEFTLNCPYEPQVGKINDENSKRTWLCVDFGNTRTCALLDLPDDDIAFYDVSFSPHEDKNKGDGKGDGKGEDKGEDKGEGKGKGKSEDNSEDNSERGVIDSICAAVHSEREGKFSFTTFGKDALWHRRQNTDEARTMFSSPKRHFWNDEPDPDIKKLSGGQLVAIGGTNFEKSLLNGEKSCSPQNVFKCSIIELLEQAAETLRMLRDEKDKINELSSFGDTKNEEKAQRIRETIRQFPEITDLIFTYPAAWTMHERRVYKRIIEEACQLFNTKDFAGCKEFRVGGGKNNTCDEATAVLMYYLKKMLDQRQNEVEFGLNPMASWIYENGKFSVDQYKLMSCRIGVVDVGGGTSDLTIAEMRSEENEANALKVKVKSVYSNGTAEAGDKLLQNIIVKMLLEMVALSFLNEDSRYDLKKDSDKKDEFVKLFIDFVSSGDKMLKKFARSFWFPLAIDAIKKMEDSPKTKKKLTIERKGDGKDDDIKYGHGVLLEKFQDFAKNISLEFVNKNDDIKIEFVDNWRELYHEAITESFSATASLMSSALMAYDCDLLLFSGRTMEIKSVQEFFKQYLPLKCLQLDNPKKATAIGAEYYARKNDQAVGYGIELEGYSEEEDENFYWYVPVPTIHRNARRDFEQTDDIIFRLSARSEIIVYRKKFDFGDKKAFLTPSYKLKYVGLHDLTNTDVFEVFLKYENTELKIKSIKKNGVECKDEWQLKLCMFSDNNQNWLDSGNIIPNNEG